MSGGAGTPPQAGPGGAFPFPYIYVASDPSVSPGRKAPVGTRAFLATGTAAWDKQGTADTAWVAVGAGAGGVVHSVTAQDATAIDDTDPANPVILEATPTNGGTISAANETKIEGYAKSGWFDAQVNFLSSVIPQLTAFEYVKLGQFPMGAPIVAGNAPPLVYGHGLTKGALEGGSLAQTASNNWGFFTDPIFQSPQTGYGAAAIRMKVGQGTIASFSSFAGLVSDSTGQVCGVLTNNSTPNFILGLLNPTDGHVNSTVAWDAGLHDFQFMWGVAQNTIRMAIDGLIVASAPLSSMPALPCSLGMYSNPNLNDAAKLMYGYVAG